MTRNSNLFVSNCSIFPAAGQSDRVVNGIPTGSEDSRGSMEEFHQQFGVYRGSGNSTGAEMAEECRGRRAAAFKATPGKVYARGIVTGSLNVNDEEAAHLQRETEAPVWLVNPFGTCQ